ncbi:hypothetical protein PanWU01x14_308460 [Parasponia andersonii]|uniref:Uncharacterized protein n=1 Tax=Parasponia andersonii TaxID=3476 RepID=A0A2P5AR82_PARAD|nr:hypothetical protein PanWU01x14_308460 [Parasponia andersonii]
MAAFLAKQVWRLLDQPKTLLYKIYKACYSSYNDFMDAQLSHSPSLTWKSILWCKELLVEGLRRKVGDENSIHCITNLWIPSGILFN